MKLIHFHPKKESILLYKSRYHPKTKFLIILSERELTLVIDDIVMTHFLES
jgi:hypothetical protein